MMISINQPAYLPWLGYFDRIANSDLHVVLDHVQFEKNSMINRNKIRTSQGWCWLTMPVKTAQKFGHLAINDIEINNNTPWQKKHWNSIFFNYKKSKYFDVYAEQLNQFYQQKWESLAQALKWQLNFHLSALSIDTSIIYSSEQNYQSTKSSLVLDICKTNNASNYLSGIFGKDYLDLEQFNKQEINVKFQQYQHPNYQQQFSPFTSHMCTLDLLFNYGPDSLLLLNNSTDRGVKNDN